MLMNIPFTLAPLIVYNLVGLGLLGPYTEVIWENPILRVTMMSDVEFKLTLGALMIIAGLGFLFIEILKATHTSTTSILDHGISMGVFIIYLIEFITVGYCATSVFFILMIIALIDVVGGFTITIRGARRDFAYERNDQL